MSGVLRLLSLAFLPDCGRSSSFGDFDFSATECFLLDLRYIRFGSPSHHNTSSLAGGDCRIAAGGSTGEARNRASEPLKARAAPRHSDRRHDAALERAAYVLSKLTAEIAGKTIARLSWLRGDPDVEGRNVRPATQPPAVRRSTNWRPQTSAKTNVAIAPNTRLATTSSLNMGMPSRMPARACRACDAQFKYRGRATAGRRRDAR